ncbi:MAG: hypothetical protein C7B45_15415 [Sulfobacillus acidophilus]|uniref:Uncharacterized protein n=1 Tax=Sulfobacillus acidophilus TaxID=53633 RepID=A0A2T2WDK2_9FIRM|nr:MAG: hypothetical protein C7B45_15415 [Sulfobacillus acidophilus]
MSSLIAHWGAWITLIGLQLALWTGILAGIVALHRSRRNQSDTQLRPPAHTAEDPAKTPSKFCKSR